MSFRKSQGNMYPWVTHTWNVIKGKCPHDCSYCYMKRFPQGELRFDEKELKRNLGKGRFIFVGSSCDMFADYIPGSWINKIIHICEEFHNKYLFQSKNPQRFYYHAFDTAVLGTTIESNRNYNISKAPSIYNRAIMLNQYNNHETFVTIEPIIDFDLEEFVDLIKLAHPSFVNIGADSKGHNLPEPSWGKVQELISALKEFTEVKVKSNLERLKL